MRMGASKDVQHQHIPQVHDGPQQEPIAERLPKCGVPVHVPQNQRENDDEPCRGDQLGPHFLLLGGDPVLIFRQGLDPFLDGGRVVVQGLYGVPGHEIHHAREQQAQDNAFDQQYHLSPLSNQTPRPPRGWWSLAVHPGRACVSRSCSALCTPWTAKTRSCPGCWGGRN